MFFQYVKQDKGYALVEILIVVGIISLISAIAIPNLISVKRTANETAARSNVWVLANAAEIASVSLGHYPVSLAEFQGFINSAPDYCADVSGAQTQVQGYNYSCIMGATGYTFAASPATLGRTGNITYTAITGGILTPL